MNCFEHPQEVAVGTCIDCGNGMCAVCSQKFDIPICKHCNDQRASLEKKEIIKELVTTFVVGGLLFLLFKSSPSFYNRLSLGSVIALVYISFSIVAGWKFLSKITPRIFLFLPIVGWIMYFVIKLFISIMVGPFVLPFQLFRNIKRLKELNEIKKIGNF